MLCTKGMVGIAQYEAIATPGLYATHGAVQLVRLQSGNHKTIVTQKDVPDPIMGLRDSLDGIR